ncbi:MAG: peptidoglycan-associated lipoprotein Pal [Proteobacteria bacterium]|nr:peptidoglycan-associated lipoprotein Pal [Pseudomonadota bacterium]MDA1030431.1 peptidoglycan-associated lipoprotein Pal [Pseudomonadota bacterium]
MTFLLNLAKFLLIGTFAFALVACQTTSKTAETVEESTDNFEYIQAESQAEQERLQQELEQAKQEQQRLQAEADKAREAQALAEEKALAEQKKADDEAAARAKAQSDAAKARADAAKALDEGTAGVVNENVPLGMPTDSVYFDFDKSFIVPKFDDVINAHAEYLKANPDLNVEIQGNCDERGSREYNIGLGNRRALAVKAGLEILGIQGSRISITSFGSEKPIALGHDESSWQQNRRADFVY